MNPLNNSILDYAHVIETWVIVFFSNSFTIKDFLPFPLMNFFSKHFFLILLNKHLNKYRNYNLFRQKIPAKKNIWPQGYISSNAC